MNYSPHDFKRNDLSEEETSLQYLECTAAGKPRYIYVTINGYNLFEWIMNMCTCEINNIRI